MGEAATQTPSGARHWALIPAAGSGLRMNAERPKQYLTIDGKTVIEHSLERIAQLPSVQGIVVVLAPDDRHWDAMQAGVDCPLYRAEGGAQRCHSVMNGLRLLASLAQASDWVLVHDAARPCVRLSDLQRLLVTLERHEVGGLLATPVRDTLKRCNEAGEVQATVARDQLWLALTPQMFRFDILLRAMDKAIGEGCLPTDEAAAVESLGLTPRVVPGHADNIKITHPEDLSLASLYLSQQEDALAHRSGV